MPIGYEILCHLKYVNHKRNLLEKENCHLFNSKTAQGYNTFIHFTFKECYPCINAKG